MQIHSSCSRPTIKAKVREKAQSKFSKDTQKTWRMETLSLFFIKNMVCILHVIRWTLYVYVF